MAYDNEYPYIDPNRHNSDWEINEIKRFKKKLEEWQVTIDTILEAIEEFNKFDGRITALESEMALVIPTLASLKAKVAEIASGYTDINERVLSLERSVDSILRIVDIKIQTLKAEVEASIQFEQNERILGDYELGVRISTLALNTSKAIEELRAELERKVPVDVYNPIKGERLDFDTNNRRVYTDLRYHGVTYGQINERPKTYAEMAKFRLKDLALNGGKIFKYIGGTLSPITGKLELTRQSLSLLIGKIYESFTYKDFNDASVTIASLNSLGYTYREMMSYNPTNI